MVPAVAVGLGVVSAPATGAVQALLPVPGGGVAPLGAFQVRLTGGEYAPSLELAATPDMAGAMTISTDRQPQSDGTLILKAYEPIPPGRWWWTVNTSAPRGAAESFPASPPQEVVVPRVVSMTEVRFARRTAQITVRYRWRTNSPKLIHRTEVFYNGTRVRRTQSSINHSESRRMAGEPFTTIAALTRNKPPFGRIHRGVWVVRVTISDGTKAVSRSKRYVFR